MTERKRRSSVYAPSENTTERKPWVRMGIVWGSVREKGREEEVQGCRSHRLKV